MMTGGGIVPKNSKKQKLRNEAQNISDILIIDELP
jgi:hypothetical protein